MFCSFVVQHPALTLPLGGGGAVRDGHGRSHMPPCALRSYLMSTALLVAKSKVVQFLVHGLQLTSCTCKVLHVRGL